MSTKARGCQNCRQRKIRCDRTADACLNCKKSGWTCPGYAERDRFLNETTKVKQRVHRQESAGRGRGGEIIQQNSAESSRGSTPKQQSTFNLLSSTIVCSLSKGTPDSASLTSNDGQDLTYMLDALLLPNSLEELAECYFFSKWVFGDVHKVSDCFLESIRAVGMARLLREEGPSTSHHAQRQYVRALQHINEALASPITAKDDDTLAAVNVLSQVEVSTAFDHTWQAYEAHIQGASALLCLRGEAQFQTSRGALLFAQTVLRLIILHMTKRVPFPHTLRSIIDRADGLLAHPDNVIWQYLKLSIRFADFMTAPNVAAAETLDMEAATLLLSSDLSSYVTLASETSYTGVARYYRACAMSQIANSIICYRIFLRRICLESEVSVQQLQYAVLESVPQYLSAARAETWTVFQPQGYDPFNRPDNIMRVALGDEAHWALYFVGFVEPTNSLIRSYVVSTLLNIGYERGNKHALLLAARLSGG